MATLVGSLRRDSYTRRVAAALAEAAPAGLAFDFVEIGDLPLYNPDLDTEAPPAAWVRLREQVGVADAVLFATPEYNRSVPGALKNAIDVGSRPAGQNAFDAKPGGVISVSPGSIGGFGANQHLRQSLVFLNVRVMQQPEAYVGGAAALFDADGTFNNERTRGFLQNFAQQFAAWIALLRQDVPAT